MPPSSRSFRKGETFHRSPIGPCSAVFAIGRSGARSAATHYRLPVDWIILAEVLLSAYAFTGLILCLRTGNLGPVFFMLTCTLGFAYVAQASIREQIQRY